MLQGKTVLLGVTGGVSAYKMVEVASRLRKLEADVHVIMSKAATNFITPLTFQSITKNPVHLSMWDKITNWNVEHISLASMADVMMVAPATANIIGKIANGIADDMLSTVLMATTCPVYIAPAMNTNMYTNKIVQDNIAKLKEYGYRIITPNSGQLACGVVGIGRLPEPIELVEVLERHFESPKNPHNQMQLDFMMEADNLCGKRIIVTAGGTRENIDPVRYIANRSSGKMGYAIARAAANRGAKVTLISGKTNLAVPPNVEFISVESALEMQIAVEKLYKLADCVIMAAAVSDYRVEHVAENKIKKNEEVLTLNLVKNPDILASLGEKKEHQLIVGFAAETQNVVDYAIGKLKRKNLDMIVANDVSQEQAGFNVDTNIVKLIHRDLHIEDLPVMAKADVAEIIIDRIATKLHAKK